ncbi:hypothetical protein GPL15_01320 [Clostridium sp. MCC353]|uniref:sodium/glutamate symporter n=1 Tax=Clostridium sp. MCC353 TaxID=2592646 RepID=UPI001C00E2C7|nr:sodium/glutamate symporter [Clostridium sp. MCC353]MBT9775145.1 hypothetical protein [Clostridium sp. MCC353]
MFGTVFNDLGILFCFLMIGYLLREIIKPIQKLFIPASVLGGLIALIAGPQVLGLIEMPESFASMASPMIVLVMTAMFMGNTISKSSLCNYAAAIDICVVLYFAQVAVGVLAGVLFSGIWKGMPEHWGILGVFAFYGGHGTAASVGAIFEEYGIEGTLGLGIVFATAGLMLAMIVGVFIINFGVRKGWASSKGSMDFGSFGGVIPKEKQSPIGLENVSGSGINSLALQLGLLFVSIWFGGKIFGILGGITPFFNKFPSFLHGMVGAAILWFVMRKCHLDGYVDKKSISTISSVALDICVTSAVATLNLKIVSTYWLPIVVYTAIIIVLNIVICFVLGRHWIKKDWFETMLIIFGQALGSSTTGLALGRCVDPETKTSAYDSFGVSAGVMGPVASLMVAVLPMLAMQSDLLVIGIGTAVVVVGFLIGEFALRKK